MASSLEILHPNPVSEIPHDIDIVFIHGLNVYGAKDHARETWTHHDGTFWPRDRLFKTIPNARVMLFSYNSSVVVDVANVSIAHHATSLLDKLYGCRSENKDRPIIFVAHSLGGLVVKQALINAVHEKRYIEIRKATFGLVFFGTPHQGGNGATHADRIANVLSVITGQTTNTLLKTLAKGSFLNEATTDQFRSQLNDYKVLTFYESQKTPLKKSWARGWARSLASAFVVDRTSAKLGSSDEILLDLNADHSQLCKFSKEPNDAAYETVGRNIRDFCDQALQRLECANVEDLEKPELAASIIGIKGFEMYMQSVIGLRNISPSLINLTDYTNFFQLFHTDKIILLMGPRGSGKRYISSYLRNLDAQSAIDTRVIMEFTCEPYREASAVSSEFCRQFFKQVVFRNHLLPQATEPATLNIDILLDSLRECLREKLSKLELTLFIEGIENTGRHQEERKEFLISILNLLQDMVKGKPIFKDMRVLLVSRFDLGIERTIKEAKVSIISIQFAQERTECLNTLQVTGVTDRRALVSDAHPGPLQWLQVHPEYCKWVGDHHSSMLWIQGKPASGKSTLVKYFREQILPFDARAAADSTFYIVADFFYSYRGGELGKSHKVMLQSLLYQILDQAGSFFEYFQDEYRLLKQQHGPSFEWPEASLRTILVALVTHQMAVEATVHLYIIIDALDESNEDGRRSILNILHQISSTNCKRPTFSTKVLMSSRPNVEAESVLRDFRQIIRMQDENRDDIGAFVSYYLEEVYRDLGFGEQEYLDVKEYIVEKSQGVFLWTHFVVQELPAKRKKGFRDVRFATLESLPSELYGIYERIIGKLLAEEDNHEIEKSEKIFQLILFAARPLSVAEFSQAMAVPTSSSPHLFTEEDLEDNIIRPTIKRPILCRGGNLVETKYYQNVDELFPHSLVYAVANSDGQDVGIVQLMHQSARDFLLRPDGYMTETERFDFRDQACHGILSIICLRYLQLIAEKTIVIKLATPDTSLTDNDACVNGRRSTDTLLTSSTDNDAVIGANGWCGADIEEFITYLDEKKLFQYALKYLPWHMNRTDTTVESGRITEELYNKLVDRMNEPSFKHVRRIYRNAFLKVPALFGRSTEFGREQSTIDDEEAMAFEDSLIKTAAQVGKVDVLLALVQNAAVNDPKSFTILQSLVELGNEQALRLFLDIGPVADLNENGGEHGNILNLAAYCGHLSIVRMLLDRGAHINVATREYGNVLEAAVAGAGSEDVVRLLIDRGAHTISDAAVELASLHGNQSVVNLLVNSGAVIVSGKTAMFLGDGYIWGARTPRRSIRTPAFCTNPVNPIEIGFHIPD